MVAPAFLTLLFAISSVDSTLAVSELAIVPLFSLRKSVTNTVLFRSRVLVVFAVIFLVPVLLIGLDALFLAGYCLDYIQPYFATLTNLLEFTPFELLWGGLNRSCMYSIYYLLAKCMFVFLMVIYIIKLITNVNVAPNSKVDSGTFLYQVSIFLGCTLILIVFCVNTFIMLVAMFYQLGPIPVLLVIFSLSMLVTRV